MDNPASAFRAVSGVRLVGAQDEFPTQQAANAGVRCIYRAKATLQAILGEAIDLWLRENGKHPFGER